MRSRGTAPPQPSSCGESDAVARLVVEHRVVVGEALPQRTERADRDAIGRAEIPVQEIQRMGGIIVEAAAALRFVAAPGGALGSQHDRAVRLGHDMGHGADCARVQKPLHLAKGTDIAIMIPDLGNQALVSRQPGQPVAVLPVETEGFLAEHVETLFQRCGHHRRMVLGRRGDDHGIERFGSQERVVVLVDGSFDVLREHIDQKAGAIADDGVGCGMGIDH